jgi:hypothetical protein
MESRTCTKCRVEKPVEVFRKTSKGLLNTQCKKCLSEYSRDRLSRIRENPEAYERLKEKHRAYSRAYYERFPEKYLAFLKQKPKDPGNELHHWSYNKEHKGDRIEVPKSLHRLIHSYLKYDQDRKMYRTASGELLDTRLKHERYIHEILTQRAPLH